MFVNDYLEHKPFVMRELRSMLSVSSLAVDHQRKLIKRTRGGAVVGQGGRTFTIYGDFGLVLGINVVPDTGLSWKKEAMSEVIERHSFAGAPLPSTLYVDYACCSGKPGNPPTHSEPGTSVTALWRWSLDERRASTTQEVSGLSEPSSICSTLRVS